MAGEAPIEHDPRWHVVSLADIATKIGSGATPKGGADAYLPTRARFALVRSQNVFDRRFDHAGLAFITDAQADGLRGVVLQPRDILLNITGDGITFGRACMVPNDVLPACVNQHVSIIRVDPRRADAGYVLAFLTHPEIKSYIESFNAGGSRRAVTKGHIESFQLPLPPLPEQRAIAHILNTLDDKIELNRRMSDTLEAMARALFKSWLVDFDPVRAKAEGRDPGLPKGLADLFPAGFVDSELGEIPEGWGIKRIGALADVEGGTTPSTKEQSYWEGGKHAWATPKDLSGLSVPVLLDTERHITDAGLSQVGSGLLPKGTVLLSSRAPIGYLAVAELPVAVNQGFIAMVAPSDNEESKSFDPGRCMFAHKRSAPFRLDRMTPVYLSSSAEVFPFEQVLRQFCVTWTQNPQLALRSIGWEREYCRCLWSNCLSGWTMHKKV